MRTALIALSLTVAGCGAKSELFLAFPPLEPSDQSIVFGIVRGGELDVVASEPDGAPITVDVEADDEVAVFAVVHESPLDLLGLQPGSVEESKADNAPSPATGARLSLRAIRSGDEFGPWESVDVAETPLQTFRYRSLDDHCRTFLVGGDSVSLGPGERRLLAALDSGDILAGLVDRLTRVGVDGGLETLPWPDDGAPDPLRASTARCTNGMLLTAGTRNLWTYPCTEAPGAPLEPQLFAQTSTALEPLVALLHQPDDTVYALTTSSQLVELKDDAWRIIDDPNSAPRRDFFITGLDSAPDGTVFASSSGVEDVLIYTPDGRTRRETPRIVGAVGGLAYVEELGLVVAGGFGDIAIRDPSGDWTGLKPEDFSLPIQGIVAFGPSSFVAAGDDGFIIHYDRDRLCPQVRTGAGNLTLPRRHQDGIVAMARDGGDPDLPQRLIFPKTAD